MATYKRPGVFIEETLRTRDPDAAASASTAVFVAAHNRGPTEPQIVRSFSDFSRIFGGFPANTAVLPYAVFQFFNNGGSEAIILRVPGAGATVAELSLNDRAGTPLETLTVESVNAGAWGNSLYVEVTDRGEDRFDLNVYAGGTARTNIVERHTDLSMDPNSERYVASVVNSIVSGSSYITVVDAFSATVDTDGYEGTRPAVLAPTALTGGADGTAATATALSDSLAALESLDRTYVLSFPGVYDTTVINAALAHAEATRRCFVVIDSAPGVTPEAAATYLDSLTGSSFGAVYYPHIHIADPGANSQGATKLVPPSGAVCGLIAQTDASRGVWKAPAGLSARLAGVVSTERVLNSTDLDDLTDGHVNAIRHVPGAGFVVWGTRTLKKTQSDKYVPVRRSLISITKALQDVTLWGVFEPNDERLWESLEAAVERYLTGLWQQGGLKGTRASEAFFVKVDESINPTNSIEAGVVNIEVGVALQHPSEFIVIKLSQWEGGASVSEAVAA